MNKAILSILAVTTGAAAGWFVKNIKDKRNDLEENKPLLERLKQAERKLYEAGQRHDEQLKRIKSEIDQKVSN